MLFHRFLAFILSIGKLCHTCIPTQQTEVENGVSTTTTTSTTTTAPVLSCLAGWTLFNRNTYSWCMKIAYDSANGDSRDAICTALNSQSVPSGFENVNEITTMTAVARSEKSGTLYLFIGAYKKIACKFVAVTATCTATNSFDWTDGYTTGTSGFNFAPGEPSYSKILSGTLYYYKILVMVDTQNSLLYAVNRLDVHDGVVCGMKAQYY